MLSIGFRDDLKLMFRRNIGLIFVFIEQFLRKYKNGHVSIKRKLVER